MESLLTPKDVKARLACSLPYVYKLVERGHLKAVCFPGMGDGQARPRSMIRFRRQDVEKLIEKWSTST